MEEEAKQHFRGWIWGEVEEEEAKQHFVRNLAVKAFPHGKHFVKHFVRHFVRHFVKHFVKVIKGLGDQPSGKPVRVIIDLYPGV